MSSGSTSGSTPPVDEDLARTLFDQLDRGFAASSRAGFTERAFRVAGHRLSVRCAGDTDLDELCIAMSHLRDGPDRASHEPGGLELLLFDGTTSEAPPMPFTGERLTARGEIYGVHSERYRVAFRFGEYTLNAYDRERRRAVLWTRDLKKLPIWYLASPFRTLFHWWLSDLGIQLVHGAGVVGDGRAALLVGRGGSGKSSTALTCFERGLGLLGDDYVAVGGEPLQVWSLYSSVKVSPDQSDRRSALAGLEPVVDADFDKAVYHLADGHATLPECAPLGKLLAPRVRAGERVSRLAETSVLELDAAISGDTLRHLPHASADTLQRLRRLVVAAPAQRLELGTDRDGIARTVRQALRESDREKPLSPTADLDCPYVAVVVGCGAAGSRVADELLGALDAEDYPRLELLVVHHEGSAPGSEARTSARVLVTELQDGRALTRTQVNERGLREAVSPLVVFVDGDGAGAWPGGHLRSAVAAFEQDPRLGAVAGLDGGGARAPWAFRRSAVEQVEGFDETAEDPEVELAQRLEAHGFGVLTLPEVRWSRSVGVAGRRARDPRIEWVRERLDARRRHAASQDERPKSLRSRDPNVSD